MSDRTFYEHPVEVRGFKFIRLKGGRMLSFWGAVTATDRARTNLTLAVSRAFKLADNEYDFEHVASIVEGLEDYAAALRTHLEKERGVQTVQERIALLRNVDGRTPEEAEAFLKKADDLEHRLHKTESDRV